MADGLTNEEFAERFGGQTSSETTPSFGRVIDWDSLFSKDQDGVSSSPFDLTNLPTSDTTKGAGQASQGKLSTDNAKNACPTCKGNHQYSIAFSVKDANDALCKGMYYTVKLKSLAKAIQGVINENGETERYFSDDPSDVAYLYIGHRLEDDKYPESQSTDEDKYDEAPLAHATVAPVTENKIEPAKTKRLWKPWATSDTEKDFIKDQIEQYRAHYYDLGDGGLTIGYGDFTPYKLGNKKDNPAIDQLKKDYPPDGPGMSKEVASAKFESNLEKKAKASSWNSNNTNNSVNVPLYQREFDALISMRYNNSNTPYAGMGADLKTHEIFQGHTSVQAYLNRGRYTLAADRIPTSYNTVSTKQADGTKKSEYSKGVTNRRLSEKDTFTKDIREHW